MISLALLTVLCAAPVPKPKAVGFEIRDPKGTVLVAADDISAYDWNTHTLTVSKPVKKQLFDDSPSEFVVTVNGQSIYTGKFWRARADEPCPGPVILLGDTPADQIRIEFNYGGPDPQPDEDTRRDPRIREVLEKARKLTENQ